jgi:hypothetical protein
MDGDDGAALWFYRQAAIEHSDEESRRHFVRERITATAGAFGWSAFSHLLFREYSRASSSSIWVRARRMAEGLAVESWWARQKWDELGRPKGHARNEFLNKYRRSDDPSYF